MMIFRKCLWFFAIALPLCFVTQGYAKDVTLGWDANTEPDLAGYKVYYKTGSSGEPYNGTGADQGPSPRTLPVGSLGDPNNPAYTLTGLDDNESYYFVVTAYDDEGFESDYSNEVPGTTPMNDTTPGGGGCLIATAAYGSCIAKEVVALRKFRDHKNSLGRSFEFYYKIYPLITYYTGGHETLRTAARLALTQVVYSVKYP